MGKEKEKMKKLSSKATLTEIIKKINEIVDFIINKEVEMNLSVTDTYNLKAKSWNAKTFKKWSRKGNCPGCGVGCGSNHQLDCWARKKLLESLKTRKKGKNVR